MKKRLLAMLLSALMVANISACNTVLKNEIDESVAPSGTEGNVPTDKGNPSQSVTDYESMRVQLENILASNYTWEEFRFQYPNCRKIDEFVNGEYSNFRVVCEKFPETFFCFSLVVGENGFSKMQLDAISAPLEILLPAYVGRSFDDIIALEGNRVGFTYADEYSQEQYGHKYDWLCIYRDDFFYQTTAWLQQGDILQEYRIVMSLYSDEDLCPWDKDMDLTIDKNATLAKNIEKIVSTQCSLETFQNAYPNAVIEANTESSITVTIAELPQVKFVFEKAVDAWIKFERTVLEKAVIDASVLFPEYVGMKLYELVECGFESENRNIRDKHYLFFYQEDCVYIVDFGRVNSSTYIYEMTRDTDVYIYSYSETWVRPW